MSSLHYEVVVGDSIEHLEGLNRTFRSIYLDPPYDLGRTFKFSAVLDGPEFKDTWDGDEYAVWLDQLIAACKKVLAKDGTLFLHMSAGQSLIPEMVLNKHFTKVEKIFWQKAHGKNTVKKKLGAVVDVIFMASNAKRKFNLLYTPLDPYYLENSYTNEDERGFYALGAIKHDKTRTSSHMYDVTDPSTGRVYKSEEVAPYGWRMPEEEMLAMIEQGRIHFSKQKGATLYKKLYKDEVKGVPLSDLWTDVHYITRTDQDKRYYPTQKPFKLLRRIVALSTDPGDWVLDPCAGSGTTGAAALSLGRHAYMIDVNPEAEPIITERLKKTKEEGIVPIEEDTDPEQTSKKAKKDKKKSKKDAKPKPQPGQTTLAGLTSTSGKSGSNPPKENDEDETSDESDDKKKPMDKPAKKRKHTRKGAGEIHTSEYPSIYAAIEAKNGPTARCGFGARGNVHNIVHEGNRQVPVRRFSLQFAHIERDEKTGEWVITGKGLQPGCKVCERRWSMARRGGNKKAREGMSDEEIYAEYKEDYATDTYDCSNGQKCIHPDGPTLPAEHFSITRTENTGLHNKCKMCVLGQRSHSQRDVIYSADGNHQMKISGDSTCIREDCEEKPLEDDHIMAYACGGSNRKENHQLLCAAPHHEAKGVLLDSSINSLDDIDEKMLCERYLPLLQQAKSKGWTPEELRLELLAAVENFNKEKHQMSDEELLAHYEEWRKRNNRKMTAQRCVELFRRYAEARNWD